MSISKELTVIPLRDVVVFPYMIMPIYVGRPRSVNALNRAKSGNREIFLTLQKDASKDNPEKNDLNNIGIIAKVRETLQLPDGNVKVLIEGLKRAKISSLELRDDCYFANIEEIIEDDSTLDKKEMDTIRFVLVKNFENYMTQTKRVNYEVIRNLTQTENLSRLTFMVAPNLRVKPNEFQKLLETDNPIERAEKVIEIIQTELELLEVDKKIKEKVKVRMAQNQKEYYLTEQMKAIQKEMGKDDYKEDIEEIEQKIKEIAMPEAVKEKAEKELKKLKLMPQMSAESTVVRNYLDWIINIPWGVKTEDIIDIKNAEDILNKDHYGLEKPKERILEFLAVRKYSKDMKGSIICFVGPPGVGKTSLAKSIANAMGRKFVRMSMGGVRDEAEIRGHRRTYIGALPGKIVQSIKKAGSMNPVFLLDEIDKIGSDYRGDPASALLEALDPEQNNTFTDHYLELELDLSKVFFITTANSLETIPAPLLDRMEVIRLSGYTEKEKLHIAKGFLIPKELKEHNVETGKIKVDDKAIIELITYYTKEAGVRSLERNIASLIRKSVKRLISEDTLENIEIDDKLAQEYLGPRKYRIGSVYDDEEVGVATGLAWTQYGGDILQIEVALFEGSGKLAVTGHLGDVMKESANIAYSVVKSVASEMGVPAYKFKDFDIHLHVPEGAVPKDGPSAGITMATAILSAVSEKKANCKIAMTGEITLRGKVLQIGGLKEKVLAAHRAGIKTVICPIENEKDLTDIPEDVRDEMEFKLVSTFDEVRALVLK